MGQHPDIRDEELLWVIFFNILELELRKLLQGMTGGWG